jgi:hypothetical protein
MLREDNLEKKDLAELMRNALEKSWGSQIPIPKDGKKSRRL